MMNDGDDDDDDDDDDDVGAPKALAAENYVSEKKSSQNHPIFFAKYFLFF